MARADGRRLLHATFLFTAAGDAESDEATEVAYSAAYDAAFGVLALPAAEGARGLRRPSAARHTGRLP